MENRRVGSFIEGEHKAAEWVGLRFGGTSGKNENKDFLFGPEEQKTQQQFTSPIREPNEVVCGNVILESTHEADPNIHQAQPDDT